MINISYLCLHILSSKSYVLGTVRYSVYCVYDQNESAGKQIPQKRALLNRKSLTSVESNATGLVSKTAMMASEYLDGL